MISLIRSEWLKVRRSVIWLILPISPFIAFCAGYFGAASFYQKGAGPFPWAEMLMIMVIAHGILFLPMLVGVVTAVLCRYEHASGGWKQLLSLPVSRTRLYAVKLGYASLFIGFTQLLFLAAAVLVGVLNGAADSIPWRLLLVSTAGGWLACLPLMALQLMLSAAWSSFAAALSVSVIFTLPNVLVINSDKAVLYYPWAQPLVGMMPRDPALVSTASVEGQLLFAAAITVSFLLFFAAGWLYFRRRAA